jgi:hypothetical protein
MRKKTGMFLRQFSNWPYPEDEPVLLYWFKSPKRLGVNKQWMMDLVFKRANGELSDFSVPWGCLPMLRLGKEFKDGVPTEKVDSGEIYELTFSMNARYKIEQAFTAISRKNYRLITQENLQELCVVISDAQQKIVIPCIEIIRFFFAINKLLAYQLLQIYNFQYLLSATMPEEKKVILEFTRKISYRSITKNPLIVKVLADVLFEPGWNEAWRVVFAAWSEKSSKYPNDDTKRIPLQCIPPIYQNCNWKVRGIKDGDRIFVQEIYDCLNYNPSSFESVGYIHPNSRPKAKTRSTGTVKTKGAKNKVNVDRGQNNSPTNNNMPFLLQNQLPVHQESKQIKIEEIPWGIGNPGNGLGDGEMIGIKIIEKGATNRITVSLNENGGPGEVQSAEFVTLSDLNKAPSGLHSFLKAVEAIKEINSQVEISVSIDEVPENSELAYCGINRRKFALVKVMLNNITSYILELDLSDGQSLSTVIFRPILSGVTLGEITMQLLVDNITRQGFWARESVGKIDNIKVTWAKHTTFETDSWGKRLFEKVIN